MFPKGIMESIINPYQGNQSEVGDLKVGTLEYKAEAQFQPLHCNYLFSQMELKFYNYLYIYIYIYIYICFQVNAVSKRQVKSRERISGNSSFWTCEAEPFLRTTKIHYRVHFSRSLENTLTTVNYVLCYKSEGGWFDPSWCWWIFH